MNVGDTVYKVVEYDPPEGDHTWMVESRVVAKVRKDGKYVLSRPFHGCDAKFVGMIFFPTAREAIEAFREQKLKAVASAMRAVFEAKRAVEWSFSAEERIIKSLCAYCGKPTRRGSLVLDEGQTAHRSCYKEFER